MSAIPATILFACTLNAVRSPIAAALMRKMAGPDVHVASAGVRTGEPDFFAAAVMDEIGLEMAQHLPRRFEDLEEGDFDLVITFSPEAQHKAVELTRKAGTQVEYWPAMDPTAVEGSREQRLAAYRVVRDDIRKRLAERFGTG